MFEGDAYDISAMYLLAMRLDKNNLIGTRAWYMLLVNSVKVPFSLSLGLITTSSLLFNAKMIPVVLLGGALGFILVKHISPRIFMRLLEVLAGFSALKMLFT